jgi:hypothetical protein
MVLSSVVILLVSSTFLVQNNYYATQTQLTGAHDNARVATELVASELRSTMRDGVVVAGAGTLTVRSPMAVGVICDRSGAGDADIYTEGGEQALTTAEVAGVAVRDSVSGDWTYATASWGAINRSDGSSAANCWANGADTVGARPHYHRIGGLDGLFGTVPSVGSVVMLFRETTFKIQTSELDPSGLGLFRGVQGGTLVEFATGMDSTARFRYKTGGSTYADTVVAASLDDIDVVRIEADARKPARTGGRDDITFGWAVDIPIRNAG